MTNDSMTWSYADPSTVSIIMSLRMDICCIIEDDGSPPPVMFANFQLLEKWATYHGLDILKIDGIRTTSAVRMTGFYRVYSKGIEFGYNHVWVRAGYTRYIKALEAAAAGHRIVKSDLAAIHADHVINRARLREIPDAWVAIFPVHKDANMGFGHVEKRLPPIDKDMRRINLPPLVAFKLFCSRLPKTEEEFQEAMRHVRGQFLVNLPHVAEYCDAIEADVRQAMRF